MSLKKSFCLVSALNLLLIGGSPALAAPPGFAESAAKGNVLLQRAVQAFNAADYASCVSLCKQALPLDHFNKNIVHLMALAYCEMDDSYNAKLQFRSALQLDYHFIECRNNYGIMLKKINDLDNAIKEFQECIKIKSSYAPAHYNLALCYQQKGDLDAAITEFKTATHLNPRYFEAQRDLGLAIYQKFERGDGGDISECLDKLLAAAQLIPNNPMIHYHLGNIYCADGDLDEGEAEFRKALIRDPQLSAAHYELARLRYLRGDPNRALFEVKEAQRVSPTYNEGKKYPIVDRIKLKQLEAKASELTEDYETSLAAWRDVSTLIANNKETLKHIQEVSRMSKNSGSRSKKDVDPEEIRALISAGIHDTEQGSLDTAKQAFAKATELDPKSFIAWQNYGALLEAEGDLQGAAAKYQAALDLRPKYDGLYYNMAYLLEKLHMGNDAGQWYRRFHELAGKYPYDPKHIVSLQQNLAREAARSKSR